MPPPAIAPSAPTEQGDATGGIIPYKNPHALVAYYLGIFSLIPMLGFFLGCVAVPLGILGLRQRKKHPAIRGTVHAWIGIIFGGGSVAVHLLGIALIIISGMKNR
jgi:hypothetical protein